MCGLEELFDLGFKITLDVIFSLIYLGFPRSDWVMTMALLASPNA